jgi:hypothetical protein
MQPSDRAKQGGLSRAVGPDDREGLTFALGETYVVDGAQLTVVHRQGFDFE